MTILLKTPWLTYDPRRDSYQDKKGYGLCRESLEDLFDLRATTETGDLPKQLRLVALNRPNKDTIHVKVAIEYDLWDIDTIFWVDLLILDDMDSGQDQVEVPSYLEEKVAKLGEDRNLYLECEVKP